MVSNTFAMIGVKEIGRKSAAIDLGGWVFGNGKILADFHISGITPSLRELLTVRGITRINIVKTYF